MAENNVLDVMQNLINWTEDLSKNASNDADFFKQQLADISKFISQQKKRMMKPEKIVVEDGFCEIENCSSEKAVISLSANGCVEEEIAEIAFNRLNGDKIGAKLNSSDLGSGELARRIQMMKLKEIVKCVLDALNKKHEPQKPLIPAIIIHFFDMDLGDELTGNFLDVDEMKKKSLQVVEKNYPHLDFMKMMQPFLGHEIFEQWRDLLAHSRLKKVFTKRLKLAFSEVAGPCPSSSEWEIAFYQFQCSGTDAEWAMLNNPACRILCKMSDLFHFDDFFERKDALLKSLFRLLEILLDNPRFSNFSMFDVGLGPRGLLTVVAAAFDRSAEEYHRDLKAGGDFHPRNYLINCVSDTRKKFVFQKLLKIDEARATSDDMPGLVVDEWTEDVNGTGFTEACDVASDYVDAEAEDLIDRIFENTDDYEEEADRFLYLWG